MTYTQRLSTYQRESIYKYLFKFSNIYVRNEHSSRRFVGGVLRMARIGAQ